MKKNTNNLGEGTGWLPPKKYKDEIVSEWLKNLSKDTKNYETINNIKSYDECISLLDNAFEEWDAKWMSELIAMLERGNNSILDTIVAEMTKKIMQQNNITEVNDEFLKLSQDMRILITKVWHKERGGEEKNYWCGSYGYFKNPTEHWSCISGEKNLKKAGLRDLAVYTGDRCYAIPDQIIQDAKDKILAGEGSEIIKEIKEIEEKINEYKQKTKICEEQYKTQKVIQKVLQIQPWIKKEVLMKEMPDFVDHIKNIEYPGNILTDLDHKVWAYIEGKTRRWGSSGCEYSNYVVARYNGKRKDVHVVYRDAYDSNKDNRSLCFNKLELQKVEAKEDKIFVTLKASSDSNARTYTFDFPLAKEKKQGLNKKDQEKFMETFAAQKNDLLLAHSKKYETQKMPVYCLPQDMCYNNMPQNDVPYMKAQVDQEYIDKEKGIWCVVILQQIDHDAGHKRQLAWRGYIIDQKGKQHQVCYETLWDIERLGGKHIKIDAKTLVESFQAKPQK